MAGNMLVMNREHYFNGKYKFDDGYYKEDGAGNTYKFEFVGLFMSGNGVGNGSLGLFDGSSDGDSVMGCDSLIHGWSGFWSRTIC